MVASTDYLSGLTQEKLKEWLDYNSETGIFTWLKSPAYCVKAGDEAGSICHGYLQFKIFGRNYQVHRLAFLYMEGRWPSAEIDHINMLKSDNRWSNLREATKQQNYWNKPVRGDSKTGIRGVHMNGANYKVTIGYDHEQYYLGTYSTLEEATAARRQAELKLFGAFAPNQPERWRMIHE